MKRISIFVFIFICELLLVTTVEAHENKPTRANDKYSKILFTTKVIEALGKIGTPEVGDVLVHVP